MTTKKRSIIYMATAVVITAAFACSCSSGTPGDRASTLYEQVDSEINRRDTYTRAKEQRLSVIKQNLLTASELKSRLGLYDQLITEYEAFVCDSAMKYVEEARKLAVRSGDEYNITRLLIKEADIASHSGLFQQAREILGAIPRASLDSALLSNYYGAHCVLYLYESEYLPKGAYSAGSLELKHIYTDSLMQVSSPESFLYLTNWATERAETETAVVVRRLKEELAKYTSGSRQYSIIASTLAHVYGLTHNKKEQKHYLALTVISDIQGAVKENMAIRELAEEVFEEGDIDRANRYMKVSLDDAHFYSASMSNAQSSRMLPVIDQAYYQSQKHLQHRLKLMIVITSLLLLLALCCLVVIIRQMRHVKHAGHQLEQNLRDMSEMSAKLQQMNKALERSNDSLKQSNRTAEEYAGLFMEFCSLTISNLQTYHFALRNLALQGNVKGLLKKLDSSDATADTLKIFYQKFDEAILNIYPAFVERVNALLTPEGKIVLKPGEKLNTELRILALIKIGISDNDKISEFLRCSLSTIYTYRSRLKRRCTDPERFDTQILEI